MFRRYYEWHELGFFGKVRRVLAAGFAILVSFILVVMIPWACVESCRADAEQARQDADPAFCRPSQEIIDPHYHQGHLDFRRWCHNVAHKGSIEGVVVTCSCPDRELTK